MCPSDPRVERAIDGKVITVRYWLTDSGWVWACEGCWLGTGLPSFAAAVEEYQSHVVNDHDRTERVPDA